MERAAVDLLTVGAVLLGMDGTPVDSGAAMTRRPSAGGTAMPGLRAAGLQAAAAQAALVLVTPALLAGPDAAARLSRLSRVTAAASTAAVAAPAAMGALDATGEQYGTPRFEEFAEPVGGRPGWDASSLFRFREGEGERRPLARCPVRPDPPTVAMDDPRDQGKPDTGPFELVRPMQTLEHTEQLAGVAGIEAGAIVGD